MPARPTARFLTGLLAACALATAAFCRGAAPQRLGEQGDSRHEMHYGGRTRTYRVHVPPHLPVDTPVPLVLAFHGRLGTGAAEEKLTGLDAVADREGFVVVYPDGVGRSWNAGHGVGRAERLGVDDVGFVGALLDTLGRQLPIDRRRVYATGMSNGAIFVHRLACELSTRIAAVASVAGAMAAGEAERCHTARPVSVLMIHGTGDRYVPWNGGTTRGGGRVESVPATLHAWLARDACPAAAPPRVLLSRGDARCVTYGPCAAATTVALCTISGGGHTWPGGIQQLPRAMVGPTSRDLDASSLIWRFFAAHPMPPS